MLSKKKFDEIIRENLVKIAGKGKFGYKFDPDLIYTEYYTSEAFDLFIDEMKPPEYIDFFNRYNGSKDGTSTNGGKGGVGGELRIQYRNGKPIPPKMASVASSSRFCYLALRDGGQALGGDKTVILNIGLWCERITTNQSTQNSFWGVLE